MSDKKDPARPHDPVIGEDRDSDPNAGSEPRLAGDMGVSSERVAPDPDGGEGAGVTGQGTRGSALGHTNGELDVEPTRHDAVDVSRADTDPQGAVEVSDR